MTEQFKQNRFEGVLSHKQIRSLRNLLGKSAEEFIKCEILSSRVPKIYIPICPDYPHDGRRFTYKEGKVGNNYSPQSEKVIKKINLIRSILGEHPIQYTILVCDIEGDIDAVSKKYADNDFEERIQRTSKLTGEYIASQLKSCIDEVDVSTFYQYLWQRGIYETSR